MASENCWAKDNGLDDENGSSVVAAAAVARSQRAEKIVPESILRKVILLNDACVWEIWTAMDFFQGYKIIFDNKGMSGPCTERVDVGVELKRQLTKERRRGLEKPRLLTANMTAV